MGGGVVGLGGPEASMGCWAVAALVAAAVAAAAV